MTNPDGISLKFIKPQQTWSIQIKSAGYRRFSEDAETALVKSIYKKDDRDKIKKYRPVSLLNGPSKFFEIFIHEKLTIFTGKLHMLEF